MYRIGFVIEQALGHVTHGQNLKKNVSLDSEIEAHWILPTWELKGIAARIPVYKSNWTLRAGLQAQTQIGKLQRDISLDGLFFHTQVPSMFSQHWLRRFPSVVSIDATPLQYDRLGDFYDHETGPSWIEQKKYQMTVSCFQAANHLVAWSYWAKQGLVDEYGVEPEKITVIPPGVIIQDWYKQCVENPSGTIVKILFVGGQFERKGGNVLLESFRRLRYKFVNKDNDGLVIELHLVTKDKVDPEPGVIIYNDMKPNSSELKQLFHTCHIFCLPTFGDTFGMVLSEAGASGMPLVSTSVAAIPEVIHADYSGLLTAPGDVKELENALYQLITQPQMRYQMGKNAQDRVIGQYDAQKNAEELSQLIKNVIKNAQ